MINTIKISTIFILLLFFGCKGKVITPEGAMIFYTNTSYLYEVSFNSGEYNPVLYKCERPYCYETKEKYYTVQLPLGKYPIAIKKGLVIYADTVELKEAMCQAYNVTF